MKTPKVWSLRYKHVGIFSLFLLLATIFFGLLLKDTVVAIYQLAGFDRPKEYIVLLQNNMEIRATGGFMGSFARVDIKQGKLSLQKIEDIYIPDGQLDGHVEPPWPIQAAFGQGWFKLRDSNWDPDFPTAAKTIEWFFEHGKEPQADGLIAVNLSLLQTLLRLTGPIFVLDEPEKITYDNFYQKTQTAVEQNFFPGSIQKRNFLSKLGQAVFEKVSEFSFTKKIQLAMSLFALLRDREIFVYAHDGPAQKWLKQNNFDGALSDIRGTNKDYLAVYESNLGANKANCCIVRQAELKREASGKHELRIKYTNTNPSTLKQPPQYWGGAYVNFLRIGIPLDATIGEISVSGTKYPLPSGSSEAVMNLMRDSSNEELLQFVTGDAEHLRVDVDSREEKGIKLIGFFVLVDALSENEVILKYQTSEKSKLIFQKQSGIDLRVN